MSVLLLCVLMVSASASSLLSVPSMYQSNMVLQRQPQMAVVHGKAAPNSLVHVTLIRHDTHKTLTFDVNADANSQWEAQLPPQPKGGPATITFTSAVDGGKVVLDNVLFGDVILCSGQSNMEFDVTGVFNYTAEQADSVNYPNMRLFEILHNPQSGPVDEAPIKGVFNWVAPSPQVLGNFNNNPWNSFSAVCYYTGRELMRKDPSVPLGLLTTCFGGTSDVRWSSPEALKQCDVSGPHEPFSDLWYGMVTPFLKMRFSAMLWYQGENDAGHPSQYACTFPAMIQNWRKNFNLPKVPFGFVELAGYPKADYSLIRLAQQEALKVDNVFMATAIDLGDPTSPFDSIHPRLKQEVARRLSLGLQKEMYNIPVVSEGPKPRTASVTKNAATGLWSLSIVLDNADQLHLKGTASCTTCCSQGSPVDILISGKWTTVPVSNLKIAGNSLTVVGTGVAPTSVRGMFGGYPQCALYNAQTLASPTFTLDVPTYYIN